MAVVSFLTNVTGQMVHQPLATDRATRFDSFGEINSGAPAVASIVAFSAVPPRYAVVASADASVAIGSTRVSGVFELSDRDRVFVAGREMLVSLDELPLPVDVPAGASCPVCDRSFDAAASEPPSCSLRACPRCGARACEDCWGAFRGAVCLTSHCEQPASLDRALWRPEPDDFLDFEADVAIGSGET